MKCYLHEHRRELLEVLSTWMSQWLWTTFLMNVRRVGDELRWRGDIHLLKPFIGHNRSAHGHQLEVMVEMLYAWIEKHNLGVIGSALHLNEKLVMRSVETGLIFYMSICEKYKRGRNSPCGVEVKGVVRNLVPWSFCDCCSLKFRQIS
jgi:hypothetical protein